MPPQVVKLVEYYLSSGNATATAQLASQASYARLTCSVRLQLQRKITCTLPCSNQSLVPEQAADQPHPTLLPAPFPCPTAPPPTAHPAPCCSPPAGADSVPASRQQGDCAGGVGLYPGDWEGRAGANSRYPWLALAPGASQHRCLGREGSTCGSAWATCCSIKDARACPDSWSTQPDQLPRVLQTAHNRSWRA